jgi:choline dehydrogenase-like flavoprotein
MFTDARTLPDQTSLEADLAIIGGGVAGITLAHTLAGSGISVCVVEAGGLEPDPEVQSLYEGENTGIDYSPSATRLRLFGGSSNHWGGYCRPLDAIDFEQRDWLPFSGWPFAIDELMPYYKPASEIVEVAPGRFDDSDYWQRVSGEKLPELATGRMRLQFVQFSPPTRFGSRYGDELKAAANIRILLNANVTRISATDDAHGVKRLAIRTLNGLRHSVIARYYVLAAGGLENARILLLSNNVVQAGLGNQNDLVGRFFMEHPHMGGFAEMVVADLKRLPKILRERVRAEGRSAKAAFNPTQTFLREHRLLNATFMMGVAGKYPADQRPEAATANDTARRDMLMAARHFLTDNDHAAKLGRPDDIGVWLGMGGACEQAPNPDSRVSLSTQHDALDLAKIKLDWRLTEQDRLSFYTHLQSLALEFGALGIGRLREMVADQREWPQPVGGGSHHMGTTRMSDNPLRGVVDRNCKVHAVDNLYVAGSSVFPTSGASNPTLTLVALTLRLADHLKGRIR